MARHERQPLAPELADEMLRGPAGDRAAARHTWSRRRLAFVLVPMVVILACVAVDAGTALSNPPASRYAGISPAFASQAGWSRIYIASHSKTRDRAWQNEQLPVPVGVEISAKSYPSTLLAAFEASRQDRARPGGGEWEAGHKFTSTHLEAASAGARDTAGWETSCAAADACGAYLFTLRYANTVLTVSIVSIPREPPMTTTMALHYLADVTKLEPHSASR